MQVNMSVLADGDGASLDVRDGQAAYFACHAVGFVTPWPFALLLNKGVNLSLYESAVGSYFDFDYRSIAGDACQVHAVGCTEVAEAVSNESSVIYLHAAYDVRAVPIDHVGAVVNTEVGEGAQVAPVFA